MKPHKMVTLIKLTAFAAVSLCFTGLSYGKDSSPPNSRVPTKEELTITVYSFPDKEDNASTTDKMVFYNWLQGLKQGKGLDNPTYPRVFHRTFEVSDALTITEHVLRENFVSILIEGTVTPLKAGQAQVKFSKLGHPALFPVESGQENKQPVKTSLIIHEGEWRVLRLPAGLEELGKEPKIETIVILHLEKPPELSGKSPYEV